jgi:hypothetical protein
MLALASNIDQGHCEYCAPQSVLSAVHSMCTHCGAQCGMISSDDRNCKIQFEFCKKLAYFLILSSANEIGLSSAIKIGKQIQRN